MASAKISCQNQASFPQSAEQAMDSDVMDHSQHLALNSSDDGASPLGCCLECNCGVGGCSASVLLSAAPKFPPFDVVLLTRRFNERVDGLLTASLFRPPISR